MTNICQPFRIAGLDTTGSVLSFAVYVLALQPEIQEKLFQEVNGVMKGKNGKVDYDGISHMEYMDKFVSGKTSFVGFEQKMFAMIMPSRFMETYFVYIQKCPRTKPLRSKYFLYLFLYDRTPQKISPS